MPSPREPGPGAAQPTESAKESGHYRRVGRPETIFRLHRAGFKAFCRWKRRKRRAAKDRSRMAQSHPADEERKPQVATVSGPWRAVDARFEVAQSTVSKYVVQGGSPAQGWRTFLRHLVATSIGFHRSFETRHHPCQYSGRHCYSRSEDVGRRLAGIVLIHDHPDHGCDPDEKGCQGAERSSHWATMIVNASSRAKRLLATVTSIGKRRSRCARAKG
jgi:hypothetical protein